MNRFCSLFLTVLLLLALAPIARAQTSGWSFRAPMPSPRAGAAVVAFEGKIWVIGGRTAGGSVTDRVERYDPATDTWETNLPELRDERVNGAAVVFGDRVVVTGGRDADGNVLKDAEYFDRADNRWRSFPNLRREREGHAMVVLNGQIYAAGGVNRVDQITSSTEFYNASDGNWNDYPDWALDVPRASFATVEVDGAAYSIAGFSTFGPLGLVQRYEVNGGATAMASLDPVRGGHAAAVRNRQIFVLGGRGSGNFAYDNASFYDVDTNAWTILPPLQVAREAAGAATVGSEVYVLGGYTAGGQVTGTVEMFGTVGTSVETLPAGLASVSVYPNPARERAHFSFELASPAAVNLTIFDGLARRVTVLVDGRLPAGRHTVPFDADLPVGVYFYRLSAGDAQASGALTLIR
jgi:N-acetylneuraminic acid mutarotase